MTAAPRKLVNSFTGLRQPPAALSFAADSRTLLVGGLAVGCVYSLVVLGFAMIRSFLNEERRRQEVELAGVVGREVILRDQLQPAGDHAATMIVLLGLVLRPTAWEAAVGAARSWLAAVGWRRRRISSQCGWTAMDCIG